MTFPKTLLLGGAARGFVDEYSDLDIAIFFKNSFNEVRPGEQDYHGIDLDVMLFDFNVSSQAKWSHAQRQAFSEGKILFDRNGLVSGTIKNKLIYTETERRNDMLDLIMKLRWHGFGGNNLSMPHDYSIDLPYNLMGERGCIPCAHDLLNEAIDLFLQLLFVFNGTFIPDNKWRLMNSYSLKWLPSSYSDKIDELIICRKTSESELSRRANILNRFIAELFLKINERKEIPDNGYEIFLKTSGEYDPRQ